MIMKALSALEAEQSPITRFADDIDVLAGEEEKELAKLLERLDKAFTAYGMKISAQKTRLMTNNTSGINTEIKVNGRSLRLSQASRTRAQLSLIRVPSPGYSPG